MKESKPSIPKDLPEGSVLIGGPIEWFDITLRIYGDDLDPDLISKKLGINPTTSNHKNDIIKNNKGVAVRKARTGQWHLNYKPEMTDEWDCNYAVSELLNMIKINDDEWNLLVSEFKVDIFIGLTLDKNRNKGFQLEPELMKSLSNKNISIGFDIYYD